MVTKAVYTEQEYGIHHIIPEKPPSKENKLFINLLFMFSRDLELCRI